MQQRSNDIINQMIIQMIIQIINQIINQMINHMHGDFTPLVYMTYVRI